MNTSEAHALLTVARRAAEAGAHQLRQFDGKSFAVRSKGRQGDLITDADEAAEAAVLEVLRQETPTIPVLAEESGHHGETGDLLWCVDPLDGTTNFAHGYPFFATSVGLLRHGEPWLGAVVAPRLEEVFWGGVGLGAFCNDRPIQVSACTTLARSVLVTGFAYDRHERLDNNYAEFCRFAHRVGVCGGAGPPRWTWPTWPVVAWTGIGSGASRPGIRRRERPSSRVRGAGSVPMTAAPLTSTVAASWPPVAWSCSSG